MTTHQQTHTHNTPAWSPKPQGPRWSQHVARALTTTLWSVQRHGTENVPSTGPVILACNHIGFIDGPLLLGAAPRPAHFLVKGTFFEGPIAPIMRAAGQIPVTPGKGRYALDAAQQVLNDNRVIGIFPEGRRGKGDLTKIHPGVSWLACHTQAPVIPVTILGTRTTGAKVSSLPRIRSRIIVDFSQPLHMESTDTSRRTITQVTERIREAMSTHVQHVQNQYRIALPTDDPGSP